MNDEVDPLTAMLMENPPKNAREFRKTLDTMSLMLNSDLPEIGAFHDDVLIRNVDGHDLTVDIHVPKGDAAEGKFPVLVYLHGGGWIMGSPKTHRRLGFRFAESGFLVVNVHYRMGPENPFPGAFYDCIEAIRWAAAHAGEYGGDASRLAVGGDSAGGNLTAACSAALADHPDIDVKAILLIYAVMDFANMNPGAFPLPGGADPVEMMVGSYIGHDRENLITDWRVSPIHVVDRLPPAHVLCGTADELIADAREAAKLLDAAGIDHELAIYEDMPHGFVQMEEMFPDARTSIEAMVAFLDARL